MSGCEMFYAIMSFILAAQCIDGCLRNRRLHRELRAHQEFLRNYMAINPKHEEEQ